MKPHHEQAVEMSEMVLAADPPADVAAIAGQIKSAQSPEIEQMETMLADLGEKADGAAHSGGHSGGMAGHRGMMSDADMDALMDALMDATGADAARRYLEGMVKHHQGAIEASDVEIADGQYGPAIELAKTIKTAPVTARMRRHPVLAALLAVLLVLAAVWAVAVVRLQGSVAASADYWAEPRGGTGGLLYVALGDSVAQGIGASSPRNGYVSLIAERLRDSTGGPVQVVNLSRSGARIRDVLDTQLPALDALGRSPDIVTVAIGGNDIRAYDRTTFAAEAGRLAAALPAGAYVADAPYFMHGRWERDADQAAALLRTSATARGPRPVALHDALKAQGWQAMLTQFAADWFHPNDRGHRVWADAFWQEMADSSHAAERPPSSP